MSYAIRRLTSALSSSKRASRRSRSARPKVRVLLLSSSFDKKHQRHIPPGLGVLLLSTFATCCLLTESGDDGGCLLRQSVEILGRPVALELFSSDSLALF